MMREAYIETCARMPVRTWLGLLSNEYSPLWEMVITHGDRYLARDISRRRSQLSRQR